MYSIATVQPNSMHILLSNPILVREARGMYTGLQPSFCKSYYKGNPHIIAWGGVSIVYNRWDRSIQKLVQMYTETIEETMHSLQRTKVFFVGMRCLAAWKVVALVGFAVIKNGKELTKNKFINHSL